MHDDTAEKETLTQQKMYYDQIQVEIHSVMIELRRGSQPMDDMVKMQIHAQVQRGERGHKFYRFILE